MMSPVAAVTVTPAAEGSANWKHPPGVIEIVVAAALRYGTSLASPPRTTLFVLAAAAQTIST
jgi:hypothetical protein